MILPRPEPTSDSGAQDETAQHGGQATQQRPGRSGVNLGRQQGSTTLNAIIRIYEPGRPCPTPVNDVEVKPHRYPRTPRP